MRHNFFDIGGHSLLANSVTARINDTLDVNLSMRVLFEKPTIEQLSSYILQEIARELSMEAT